MKIVQVGFLSIFSIIFLASSFIKGSSILNGSMYSKQFWIEYIIVTYSVLGIGILFSRLDSLKLRITLVDVLVALITLIYLAFILSAESNPLTMGLPFYYVIYYFLSKFIFEVIGARNFEVSIRFTLSVIPLLILGHLALMMFGQTNFSISINQHFNLGNAFGNPDMLGSYLAVLMPFCFMQERAFKILGFVAFILSLIALICLQARTSLLAVIGCGFCWYILEGRINRKVILTLSVILFVITFMLIYWHPESVFGRFFIWLVSIRMILAKPLGWGLFAFERHYPEFQSSFLLQERTITKLFSPEVVHSPFNEFISIGTSMGIITLILLISLFFLIFSYLVRTKHRLLYPFLSFTIISLFYFPFRISPIVSLIIPLVAWISNDVHTLYLVQPQKIFKYAVILFLFLSTSFLAFKSVKTHALYKQWQYSYSLSLVDSSIVKAEQLYFELYPNLRTDGRFLITYSNLLSTQGKNREALQLLVEAADYFCDITSSLNLAMLYESQGDYSRAEGEYNRAISLAPNRMTSTYEKILFLKRTGRNQEAYLASIELFNRPIDGTYNADGFIMKSRLQKLIKDYESAME